LQSQIACHDDQWAYKELFTSFYPGLFNFAGHFIKSRQAADEIVSDVFIRVWEKRRDLEKVENLKVYLFVAVRNMSLNYLDKQKRTPTGSLDETDSSLPSLSFNPEQLMISAEMIQRIQKAISDLPQQCRTIFRLVKEERLRYKEVAEILQISVKTVENQLAIGVRKIGVAIQFDIKRALPASFGKP
jgi:RNA polymerase sigma-70 factor (ECF subfamily)